jgi:hypothetical protein
VKTRVVTISLLPKEDQMTFRSLLLITVIGGSLWACVNKHTPPDPELESTSMEPASGTSEASEESAPSEVSGTCDDRTCVSSNECCKGYECGFDPGRSRVLKYCLSQ